MTMWISLAVGGALFLGFMIWVVLDAIVAELKNIGNLLSERKNG
jgi:nitrate/nitrite transporter NarK